MNWLNVWSLIEIPLLIIILIRTYKSDTILRFWQKIMFLIGIEFVLIISILTINLINPFNRRIDSIDLAVGIIRTGKIYGIIFIICIPLTFFVKSKKSIPKY